MSEDGRSIAGKFAQAGYSMPFALTRTGDAKIEATPKSATIGKALEGTWSGTLDVSGVQRQLVLTLANQPDGTSDGRNVLSALSARTPIHGRYFRILKRCSTPRPTFA